jgi:hypothetical protein
MVILEGPLAILTCPGCGRGGLRVPDGRCGKVTCPTCGAEWFHPETIESSDVAFRCAKSGARFTVTSSRRSPLHKFVIKEIQQPSYVPPRAGVQKADQIRPTGTNTAVTVTQPLSRKVRWWLARLGARHTKPTGTITSTFTHTLSERADAGIHAVAQNANEYDWGGFYCPYCKAKGVIKCGSGHLVCNGGNELTDGGTFHTCFCGSAGFIRGTIETFNATRRPDVIASIDSPKIQTARGANDADRSLLPPVQQTSVQRRADRQR